MKKILISLLALSLLIAGFYFGILKIDPLSILIGLVLLGVQAYIVMQNNALATVVKESHKVLAANQKELSRKVDVLRLELRKK